MTGACRRAVWGIGLLGVLAVAGCGGGAPPAADPMLGGRVGDNCTVYFRRDALGMAGPSPSSPLTGNHNGADTAVSGKLTIPKSAILVIETTAK